MTSDVGGKGSAEHHDRASNLFSVTGTTKRDISIGVNLSGTVGSRDTKGDLLTINFNGSTSFLSTSETSINPAESNSVAADTEKTLPYAM